MTYYVEDIYTTSGRDDRVANVTFIEDSQSYISFGEDVTVKFVYTERERVELERGVKNGAKTHGRVKVKLLVQNNLSKEGKDILEKNGIYSEDIAFILTGPPNKNLFHKDDERSMDTIEVKLEVQPLGGDFDWMYGFLKKQIKDGIGLTPYEREEYLAWKLFFESENITDEERQQIYSGDTIRPAIEVKLLDIKIKKKKISENEMLRYSEVFIESTNANIQILREELNSAGLSLSSLQKSNPEMLNYLFSGTYKYIPEKYNVLGAKAIYLDFKGFLHVFLRHVEEFNVSQSYKHKDKLLWNGSDVLAVIEHVIHPIENEIQEHFIQRPNTRFSKYGKESIYFEGIITLFT